MFCHMAARGLDGKTQQRPAVMCPTIGLLGGIGTEYEDFHPSLIVAASPDLFLDGKPVARGNLVAVDDNIN